MDINLVTNLSKDYTNVILAIFDKVSTKLSKYAELLSINIKRYFLILLKIDFCSDLSSWHFKVFI